MLHIFIFCFVIVFHVPRFIALRVLSLSFYGLIIGVNRDSINSFYHTIRMTRVFSILSRHCHCVDTKRQTAERGD